MEYKKIRPERKKPEVEDLDVLEAEELLRREQEAQQAGRAKSWEPSDGEDLKGESSLEDIYGIYMEEIAAIAPCSEEENRTLLGRIKKGDAEARNRLIEGNLKRALFFVQDYLNKGVPMADLIQEASMELMFLADEGFEDSFETLLESRIRVRLEEVVKEQEAEKNVEEELLARINVLQEVSKEMSEELGREAAAAELAERMKMTEEEVKDLMKATMNALKLSEINRGLQS